VGLWALKAGVDLADAQRLSQLAAAAAIQLEPGGSRVLLNGEDVTEAIRTPEVSQAASRVSTIGGVRKALVDEQRRMAEQSSVVMEGRDIGSVVFPDAEIKIFLDADTGVRAERRLRESAERGDVVDPAEMARQIRQRDERDRTRAEAPLLQAPDAVYVDSTGLTIEQVEEAILRIIRERTSNGEGVAS
jgi:cytidylate kinase